ncbi:MAG: hypothetical protein INH41_24335 [Myxococcaceae bacterium]|jgi:hypothetical protein|nr:hypothetical protein [Myxococcaceae bacterium]MCA3015531.1 hypothetical protein [Myxococcaceae bacterium]
MQRPRRLVHAVAVLVGASVALSAGCSLFGNYELDGLPCDLSPSAREPCLRDAGYVCVRDGGAGVCVKAP